MRPLLTEKDDHPGPTGLRHSATGGEDFQSVLMRVPGTIPSRCGPRNPGQSAAWSDGATEGGKDAAGGAECVFPVFSAAIRTSGAAGVISAAAATGGLGASAVAG